MGVGRRFRRRARIRYGKRFGKGVDIGVGTRVGFMVRRRFGRGLEGLLQLGLDLRFKGGLELGLEDG